MPTAKKAASKKAATKKVATKKVARKRTTRKVAKKKVAKSIKQSAAIIPDSKPPKFAKTYRELESIFGEARSTLQHWFTHKDDAPEKTKDGYELEKVKAFIEKQKADPKYDQFLTRRNKELAALEKEKKIEEKELILKQKRGEVEPRTEVMRVLGGVLKALKSRVDNTRHKVAGADVELAKRIKEANDEVFADIATALDQKKSHPFWKEPSQLLYDRLSP